VTLEAEPKVLCLGDSLTAGYGIEQELAYPKLVEEQLNSEGYKVKVINAGSSGSTTASALSRFKWFVKGNGAPEVLILALGGNDGLRGQDLKQAEQNLSQVITLAKKEGSKVLLAGMKIPTNYGLVYAHSFKQMYVDLAKGHDIESIPFLLEGVAMIPALNLADGIHPNVKGHVIMAKTVISYLKPMLTEDR
jgi:acyl-CoA thioesterase-1